MGLNTYFDVIRKINQLINDGLYDSTAGLNIDVINLD